MKQRQAVGSNAAHTIRASMQCLGPLTRPSYCRGMIRMRAWLLILAAALSLACSIGGANAAMACGPAVAESHDPSDCGDDRKMSPDTMACAPLCVALAPVVREAPSLPNGAEPLFVGRMFSLIGVTGGPDPPPPRISWINLS